MSEEQACLVRARSDSENSSKLSSFGSISRTMTYTEGKLTDMLNPAESSGEPAHTANPSQSQPESALTNLDSNDSGELIDYNDASLLAQFHEDALKQAGCGMAQLRVILACGLAMSGAAIELAVIPFILPSAEIELCILSHEKSWLVLISLVGASIGGAAWGGVAGALGRRRALLSCLAVNAVFSTIAAFMPTYGTFMMARFCSGIGSGGIAAVAYSYAAEFCPRAARARALPALLLAAGGGALYAAGLARATLPHTGVDTLIENKEHFSAWHRYLLLCTLPILASLVSLIWTQESPRYLLEVGREVDAMMVYQSIHSGNQVRLCGSRGGGAGEGAARREGGGSEYRLGELELPGKRRPNALHHVRHGVHMFWHSFYQLFSSGHRHTTITLGGALFFATLLQFCISSYTSSYMVHLENERFEASKLIVTNVTYTDRHYNKTMQNVEYDNSTFVDCTFTDMFMSHVTFKNCTFVRVNFATIKTSYTSFLGCLFVNSSMIDTDIESDRDMDPYCVVNGTLIRGLRVGCKRHADLTFDMSGVLAQQTYVALAQAAAAPLALLPYRCRRLFGLNVVCAVCSGALYVSRSPWSLLALGAALRGTLALVSYTVMVMMVECYPAALRCAGQGLALSAALAGATAAQAGGAALTPGAVAPLACLLAGLAAALSLPAPHRSSENLC